jgi:hypothetical protein
LVVAGVTVNLKVAGNPTLGGLAGGSMTSVGATETLTVVDPDACPVEADGGVVVVPPPLEPPPPPAVGAVAPTLAVTIASWLVVRVVDALPSGPVGTTANESVPAVVVNDTGEDGSTLPLMSNTLAVIVVDPPVFGTVAGLALTVTRPTAAVPTAILIAPWVPVEAPPDSAVIVAVPFAVPALNFTITRPVASVRASAGSMDPSVVTKEMNVPL